MLKDPLAPVSDALIDVRIGAEELAVTHSNVGDGMKSPDILTPTNLEEAAAVHV